MKAKANSAPNGVPLSGDINQMTAPWLFQALSTGSKTGTAVFEYVQEGTAEKVAKKVYFANGDITFASSNIEADRLGDRLLKAGTLTQAQFDASTDIIKKTGKRQGAVLVELGFIKPQDLVAGVKDQVKNILQSLFAIRNGTYRFTEGPLPLADIIPLQMSTGNVILECVNAMPWDSVRKALPPPTSVVRPATDPKNLFQDAQLNTDEKAVLALIDGQRKIEEICSLSGIGDFNALRAIHLLLALRMAELGELKAEEAEFAREAVKRPAEPDLVLTREMILEVYDKIDAMDYYEALRIDPAATPLDIKRAYFRMAKAYHPDRHFDPAMADIKDKLEHLFHIVHQAYEVLSSPEKRADYDRTPRSQPAPQPQAQGTPASEFTEKHAEDYDENYKEKAERAAQWYHKGLQEFKSGNYWGSAESLAWATRLDPIKAPYFFYYGLCLSFIPRRRHEAEENLQKALDIDPSKVEFHIELSNLYLKAGLKAKALSILNAAAERLPASEKIKEAIVAAETGQVYATLSKTSRSEETGEAESGQKLTGQAAKAQEKYTAGMREYKVGNFPLAVDGFSEAARLDPGKANYHFYLGMALYRIHRRQAEAETSFRKALELDPSKSDYHMALGTFYLRAGLKAKALGVLNNALLRFPNIPKIKEAIVAAGGSVGTAAEAAEEKKGGVFSKFFKGQK